MRVQGKRFYILWGFSLLPCALGFLAHVFPATAQERPYYEGKTVKIIVASSVGGGTDSAARVMSRFLPKHLPGNPSVLVQNMPGGGGIIANNYFYRKGRPNGLDLLQASSTMVSQFSRGGKRIKYDPRKFLAIGSINRGGSILMIRKDARSRLTDPKAKPVVVADPDGTYDWLAMPVWGAEYLGWNTRHIYGYSGTGEMILALRQGEIEMMATSNAQLIDDLVKDKVVDMIAVGGSRRRDYPDVPTFQKILGDKRPSGVSWQAYRFWHGQADLDKLVVVAPGTPDNIVSIVREAYQEMAKDPGFGEASTRFFGQGWAVRGAKETEALVIETTTASKEVKDFLHTMRKKRGRPAG